MACIPIFGNWFLIVSVLQTFFAVSYDESLNKIAQKTQMHIHIRYVDKKNGLDPGKVGT